ncbi:unnamed protein product [Rotaria magnacalcarata]|uniref:Uncharacterized protein n=1 Tax=Rotaria magnacalcarata TaxID=392030 RepID=A0A816EVC1_9BILA|nr:unnamed protein product [Rotaria magnacalcarata]
MDNQRLHDKKISLTQVVAVQQKNVTITDLYLDNDYITEDQEESNVNDEDDNDQVKQDYDLDNIHAREQLVDDDLDTTSDSQEDENVENVDIEDEIPTTISKHSPVSKKTKSTEEHILSKKFIQLSTSPEKQQQKSSNQTRSKDMNIDDLKKVPIFLAKDDKAFGNMLNKVLESNNTSPNKLEDYRLMTILIYRIKHSEILLHLWTTYRRSGSGLLKTYHARNELGPLFWPKPIKYMVKVTVRFGTEEHDACLAYVESRLVELEKMSQESHTQLKFQINRLSSIYSSTVRQVMDTFVEQQLTSLRMKIEHKVELLHYDYDEHILQLEYLEQQPTEVQIQLAKELCTAKQQEELSKYTSELLDQHIIHHNASSTFDRLPIDHVLLFDSITDTNIRQQFYVQYRQVIEQSKTDMFTLYTKLATTQKQRYQNQYNDKMKQILQEQKLTNKMNDLIERRTNLISLVNEAIVQLVRLVLRNQFFIYKNKLYQQVYGNASESLIIIPLVCIYLFYGQSTSLIQTLRNNKNEAFGRYHDDFILIWNISKDQYQLLSNEIMIHQQHPNISPFSISMGTKIRLLDLELAHNHGRLLTKIYHDTKTDQYDLPNKFHYGTSQPSSLLKLALKHAVHCCSQEKYFQDERHHIELCHLIRGFSSDFINKYIVEFYDEFKIKINMNHRNNSIPYDSLRQHVLGNYKQ